MSRIRQARELREEGFTLIELLIVIVVLGILAGIVVFGVGTFRGDSQLAACKADMKTVSVAADAWNPKTGSYAGPAGPAAVTVDQLVTAKYIKAAPTGETISIDLAGAVTQTGGPAGCVVP